MKKRGLFVTIEGGDGAGKSTQARLLAAWLRRRGVGLVHTREPGGTSIAEAVRRVLLHPKSRIAPMTELFLYEAARAQHVAEVVGPALARGELVLCERYTDATEAYQGWGRGLDRGDIALLNRAATGGLRPDLTILLSAPAGAGLRRARSRRSGGDRLERASLGFHRRVSAGYAAIARREPARVKSVPWRDGIENTHHRISLILEKFLQNRLPPPLRGRASFRSVIPAKAGIQGSTLRSKSRLNSWTPASAGVTAKGKRVRRP